MFSQSRPAVLRMPYEQPMAPCKIRIVRECYVDGKKYQPGALLELPQHKATDVVAAMRAEFAD